MVDEVNGDVTVKDMLNSGEEIKSVNPPVNQPPVQTPVAPKLPPVPAKPAVAQTPVAVETPNPINPAPVSSAPAVIKPVQDKPKPVAVASPQPIISPPGYNTNVKKTSKKLLIVLGILLVVLLVVVISVGIYFYLEVLSEDGPEAPAEGATVVVDEGGQVNDSGELDLVSVVSSDVSESFSLGSDYNLPAEIVTRLGNYVSLLEYCGASSSTSETADANDETLVCMAERILDDCQASFMVYGADISSLELYEVFRDSNEYCVVQTTGFDGSPEFISVSDFEWSVNGSSTEYSDDVLAKVPLEIYNNP